MKHEYIADVLDDAADYIEKHGWVQGRQVASDGRVCAVGAIRQVSCGYSTLWEQAGNALRATIGPHVVFALPSRVRSAGSADWVAAWNDREGRTQTEVLDAFRLAAKQERRIAVDSTRGGEA